MKSLERLKERRVKKLKFCFCKKVIFKMCKKIKQRRFDMVRKRKRKRKFGRTRQLFGGLVKGLSILDSRTIAGLCRRGTNGTVLYPILFTFF